MPQHDMLVKYADVAVLVGIGLEPGDRLLVHASIADVEFVRVVAERAYAAGAVNVDVIWSDDGVTRARFSHGSDEAARSVTSVSHGRLAAHEAGDCMLYIHSSDPTALAGLDPARIAAFQRMNQAAVEAISHSQGTLQRAWSVMGAPTPGWATSVFPDAEPDEAVELLWQAIFRACRVDEDDPVGAWRTHLADLEARSRHLTTSRFTALRYAAPGTDLTLGLPDGALWVGGNAGSTFVPNIPTEEVFTAPHRLVGEGTVRATKPISLFGDLVEDMTLDVSGGEIVRAGASRGQALLDHLLETDAGSTRFGEVAMVPMSSAVAAERLVWNSTLFDENDGCHIAIGRAYPMSVGGGIGMSRDELEAAGLNHSTAHVDFVVGSSELDVFGILPDGSEVPIITGGEWGFTP